MFSTAQAGVISDSTKTHIVILSWLHRLAMVEFIDITVSDYHEFIIHVAKSDVAGCQK